MSMHGKLRKQALVLREVGLGKAAQHSVTATSKWALGVSGGLDCLWSNS